jgi:hypothetical protein
MQQTHPRWTPRVGCTKISVDAIVAKISTDEMVGEVCRRVVSSSIGCQACHIQPPPDGLCMIKCHVSLKKGDIQGRWKGSIAHGKRMKAAHVIARFSFQNNTIYLYLGR